ncbi:hypothetical protein [Alienimonas chondri]|uniref:hypothetical protein n=1 Tax=Alienimonas chondri TaxID=2681879 RepID=UPI00148799CF|nr:hypothetical protein [Alienimonas chondri]
MTTIIRRLTKDSSENYATVCDYEWRLREQVEALQDWLKKNRHSLPKGNKWIADIGFSVRPDALAGGPPIYRRMMEMCLEVNMEIYLSEYGGVEV